MKRQMKVILAGLILIVLGIGLVWMIKSGGRFGVQRPGTGEHETGTTETGGRETGPDVMETEPEKTATPAEAEPDMESDTKPETEAAGTLNPETDSSASGRRKSKKAHDAQETEPEEEVKGPPKIMIASDTHLLAKELMDGGTAFMNKMLSDDGKTTAYSGEIVDALLDEALLEQPDALVLSGDLTFEGERLSHQELAGKLKNLQDAGVQVLVIPGNHDIHNTRAAAYVDEKEEDGGERASSYRMAGSGSAGKKSEGSIDSQPTDKNSDAVTEKSENSDPAEEKTAGNVNEESVKERPDGPITASEFADIYQEFGYAQAISRDENSLSYIYPLRDNVWLMMLDTNQYEPKNLVDGEIRPETYQWMIRELDKADEEGVLVVPIGHHNLLSVSRLYTRECMILSRASALWLFGEHDLPLYLSGHLHVQRMKKFKTEPGVPGEAYGVHEIVTSSLGMAPHQYGVLTWDENRQMEYTGRRLDVESYARRIGSQDENLLNFTQYTTDWYYQIVETQIYKKLHDYPEDIKQDMAHTYADVLYHYGAGENMDQKDVETTRGYRMWDRLLPDSKWRKDIDMMLKDMK